MDVSICIEKVLCNDIGIFVSQALCSDFGINIRRQCQKVDIDDTCDTSINIPREIFDESIIEANADLALSDTLNKEQHVAYNESSWCLSTDVASLEIHATPQLVRNMRAQSDPWFVEYLLRIGGGSEVNGDGDISLLDGM